MLSAPLKKILLAVILALLAFMVTLIVSSKESQPIRQLVVFGDSLSDMGNVYQTTGRSYPPSPPYFQGRYSNGRVWVEYLGDRLHLNATQILNFAYGGATSGSESTPVMGLLKQVQSFTQTHQHVNSNTLFVVWAGANDYLQGATNSSLPVHHITQAIDLLVSINVKRLLVGNLPDLGMLPATYSSNDADRLNQLAQAHNSNLRRSLKQLQQQHSDLQIVMLNASQLYQEAIAHPKTFKLKNVTTACLSGSEVCPHPEQFLFWDGIHPTTAAHQILGDAAFAVIQEQGMVKAAR
jgi:phospholipase/lecithinase/hemolysin